MCPRLRGFFSLVRLAIAFRFETFEFLAHGCVDDGSEIDAGHERLEPLEFVAELLACRKRHFVARW